MVRKPYKFTKKRQKELLDLLAQGTRRGEACEAVGISRHTFNLYKREDPNFAAAVDEAETRVNEQVEDALLAAALSGNVVAIQVWLYNRSAMRWADKRHVEHSGEIPVRIVDDVPGTERDKS